MPNVISAFRHLNCAENIYWGTSAGKSHYFGDYFRGLAYAMSWPLVSLTSRMRGRMVLPLGTGTARPRCSRWYQLIVTGVMDRIRSDASSSRYQD